MSAAGELGSGARTGGARGTVRYWAAARAATGLDEEEVVAATLAEALAAVLDRHRDKPRLPEVLGVCSYVVDGRPAGRRDPAQIELVEPWVIEVLPPFAGG